MEVQSEMLLPGVQPATAPIRGTRLKTRTKTNAKVAESIKEAKSALRWPPNYVICKDILDLGRVAVSIARHKKFSFDTETSGLNPWTDKLSCVSIYVGGTAYLINFRHPLLPQISMHEFASVLGSYFADPSVERIGFNVPFDYHFIEEQAKVPCGPMHFDGSVATWLLYPDEQDKKLKPLCEKYCGTSGKAYGEAFGRTDWTMIDPEVAAYYAAHDAELHWTWYEHCEKQLKREPDLHRLMHELEMPVANVYYETEREGLLVDVDYLRDNLSASLAEQVTRHKQDVYDCANAALPRPWLGDVNNPKDLSDLLFNKLKLRRVKGDSTDRWVLAELKDAHPIIPLVTEYRSVHKLKTAFVDALPELLVQHEVVEILDDGGVIDVVVHKVHPDIRIIGSVTGRTSMSDPNLLQMPARVGPMIRRAFLSCHKVLRGESPDWYLVSKDYSGQELRIQAALSGDTLLREIVNTGGDIYSETAAVFYGGKSSEYTKSGPKKKERDKGKAAVLALSYGASEYKIAQIFECSVERAKKFIEDFWKRFPGLKAFVDKTIQFAKKHGYVQTVLGRRRPAKYFEGMAAKDAAALDRLCANTPIQGSAADQIKLAIVLCDRHLKSNGYKSRVVMGIHDEIIFRVSAEEWNKTNLPAELSYIMEHALEFPGIPMRTSAEVYAYRWSEVDDGSLDRAIEEAADGDH